MPSRRDKINASGKQIDAFIAALEKLLKKQLPRILKDLDPKKKQAAIQILGDVVERLEAAGLKAQVLTLQNIYAGEVDFITREFSGLVGLQLNEVFTGADRVMIERLMTYDFESLRTSVEAPIEEMRSGLTRSILMGEEFDIFEIAEEVSEKAINRASTVVNTSVMGFSRSVTMAKAQDLGLNLFEYIGPNDDLTRPFCNRLLNKKPSIYTLEEIQRMDNKQGLDVRSYGGGYNCRHDWGALTEERARELGWV